MRWRAPTYGSTATHSTSTRRPKTWSTRSQASRRGFVTVSSSAVRSSSTVATQPMPFREPIRPGQAGTLVHFCGRGVAATSAPQEILELTPQQRLEGIIGDRMIRASQPFGLSYPVVSFSECDHGGVQAMLAQAGWDAWGI